MSISATFEMIKAALLGIGAPGVLLIAVLDSSLLTLPEINDIIIVSQVIDDPSKVFYLPLVTATGSVIGCLLLYALAWKGGDAFLRKRFLGKRVERVEQFYARFGTLALIIPALCPPPTPFKIFVATAGALRFPTGKFIAAVMFGRTLRYTIEGVLAVIYGRAVLSFLERHAILTSLLIALAVVLFYLLYRWITHILDARSGRVEACAKAGGAPAP